MDLDALKAILGQPYSLKPVAIGVPIGENRVLFDMLHPVDGDRLSAFWACDDDTSERTGPYTVDAWCSAVENEDGSWAMTRVCRLHESVLRLG